MTENNFIHNNSDFNEFVRITAERLGTSEGIVEKDYWVTEVLRVLVNSNNCEFIFKGGTSLSKGYGLIRRFSEDVDILVTSSKHELIGQSTANKLLKQMEIEACTTPGISLDTNHTGNFSGKSPPKRVSILSYLKNASVDSGVLPFIKLEMAVHKGGFPSEERPINSFIATEILKVAPDRANDFTNSQPFQVNCLDPLRTFAEKVNAISSAHRTGELVQKVRHYYDLYYLLESPLVSKRLNSEEHIKIKQSIRDVDAAFKQDDKNHNYEQPGLSDAFSPKPDLLRELSQAYNASPIFYGEKPTFKEIIDKITSDKERF